MGRSLSQALHQVYGPGCESINLDYTVVFTPARLLICRVVTPVSTSSRFDIQSTECDRAKSSLRRPDLQPFNILMPLSLELSTITELTAWLCLFGSRAASAHPPWDSMDCKCSYHVGKPPD